MKKNKYIVVFLDNSTLIIYASSPMQAMYLGSAHKIESGEPYLVDSVYHEQEKKFFVTNKSTINDILTHV